MKVYIIHEESWDDTRDRIRGVFLTKERAWKFCNDRGLDTDDIEEHEVIE
jgi:hypothetical protein